MSELSRVQKVMVKFSYKPSLLAMARMDSVADALLGDFPLWDRGLNIVDLKNTAIHERFQIAHTHCYYEAIEPANARAAVEKAVSIADRVTKKIEINKLDRVGVAFQLIAESARPFADLVLACDKAFHIPFSQLSAFDDCRLTDSTYLATMAERDSKWERLVQLGPMTRPEYWTRNPLDTALYNLQETSHTEIKDRVPETFAFVQIDAFHLACERQYAVTNLPEAFARAFRAGEDLSATLLSGASDG